MKNMMLMVIVLLSGAFAGDKKPCCAPTATEEFAAFGKDMAFVALHEAPVPFVFEAVAGEMKTIKTSDGSDANIYEVKSIKKSDNYLFVFHEWWGLNDYIKQEAEQWRRDLKNVNIIALDLYDRKIAEVPDSAKKYVGEVKEERARAIIKAAIDYAGENAKIATLGWCFGGGWSMQTALMLGKQASGCVIYYGMPEKDVTKLKTLNCDVLGIFGTKDGFINPKVVAEFEKNMKAAKKKLTVKNFDAVHAFANPSNPSHDKEKTAEANAAALAFLKSKFNP
ncbi:MAG: dienelactone hydrolase family protein [Bacteroidota bacterium]